MLDFNDLYTIQIGDIVHICRIIYYDKINDTYTISVRGNDILSGIKEDQLEDISKHPLLPPDYQQIEWLKNSGDAYLNLGFKPDQDTQTELKFQYHESAGTGSGMFGVRTAADSRAYTFILGSNGRYAFSYGTDNPSLGSQWGWDRNIHTLKRSKSTHDGATTYSHARVVTLDSVQDYTNADKTFTCAYNALLFTYNNAGSHQPAKQYTIWYCKCWDDDNLIRDMVPCYVKETSELGMYDLVSGTFYQKQGSGSFIAGPDVEV